MRKKLRTISAASIDRLLRPERQRLSLRGRALTKPGTLLEHQIPVRTFAEWDPSTPRFVEIDLVRHDGRMGWGAGSSLRGAAGASKQAGSVIGQDEAGEEAGAVPGE